ncbi:MAG: hypothetical protein ABI540_05670 [Spartobacteria bacterium]
MRHEPDDLLADFEGGRIDPARFRHRDHVRVSYELLARHPFPEALLHLARGLRDLAARAGKPEVYHETITVAFLALIAERWWRGYSLNWEDFAAGNPDLFRKELLDQFYESSVLQSLVARQTFVLPRHSLGEVTAGDAGCDASPRSNFAPFPS